MAATPATTRQKQLRIIAALMALIVLFLAILLVVLMRGGGADSSASGKQPEQAKQVVKVYKEVLATPTPLESREHGQIQPPAGDKLKYALVHLDDDCVPELLINYGPINEVGEIDGIGVFGLNAQGERIQLGDMYHDGVASAGGTRASLQRSVNGPGMYYTSGLAMRGVDTVLVKRNGDELIETPVEGFGDSEPFNWIPASNAGEIDAAMNAGCEIPGVGTNYGQESSASASESASESSSEESEAPSAPGVQKLTGTVKIIQTDAEMAAYQGVVDPNARYGYEGGPYAVLILDTPTSVSGYRASNQQELVTGDATMVSLESGYNWTGQYSDGQRLTIEGTWRDFWWQSDTGLPMGEPRYAG